MLDKRTKRRTYVLFFNLSISSIAVAKGPQLLNDDGNRQGNPPAPDGLFKGDGEVCARSARVRWRCVRQGMVSRIG